MAKTNKTPKSIVGVLGGSKSDCVLEKAVALLNELGIPNELLRYRPIAPRTVSLSVPSRRRAGIQVIIAGAEVSRTCRACWRG
ncbi:MAG: hypothetical protein U0361_20220 [Nitrospiraceae bacterium]